MVAVIEIRKIEFQRKTMERLILPQEKKDSLLGAIGLMPSFNNGVLTYKSPQKATLILLWGGPGTGKTISTTYAAEYLHRPLITLSSGEIGSTIEVIESNLTNLLTQAQRWNAIMVIEDADSLCERREKGDMKRQSITMMCIRLFESYSGVLILTTTRPEAIDNSLYSRVTLAIQLLPLNRAGRQQICRNMLREDLWTTEKILDPRESLEDLVSLVSDFPVSLNGKQIQNVLEAAIRVTHGSYVTY